MSTPTLAAPETAAPPPRPLVTVRALSRCRLRTKARRRLMNGGWQALQQCVEHPRLTCTRWAGNPDEVPVWCLWVDGRPVTSLEHAAARLNAPPTQDVRR